MVWNLWEEHSAFFLFSPVNNKSTSCFHIFWYIDWIFYLFLITKRANDSRIPFFNFVKVSNFDWKLYVFKIKIFAKSFSAFVIFLGLWPAKCKYLMKHHLKHSLSWIYWILIKLFVDGLILSAIWYNCYQLMDCTMKY